MSLTHLSVPEQIADERNLRRLRSGPEYQQAEREAEQFVARLAQALRADGIAYQSGTQATTLLQIGGVDVSVTARPAFLGSDLLPDGETFAVRICGASPETRILYHHNCKDTPKTAVSLYGRLRRWISQAQGALTRSHQPTGPQAARDRCAIALRAFGPERTRTLSGCQARVDLPGGARLDITGNRQHDVMISNLTTQQLDAVCRAIAATLEPEARSKA